MIAETEFDGSNGVRFRLDFPDLASAHAWADKQPSRVTGAIAVSSTKTSSSNKYDPDRWLVVRRVNGGRHWSEFSHSDEGKPQFKAVQRLLDEGFICLPHLVGKPYRKKGSAGTVWCRVQDGEMHFGYDDDRGIRRNDITFTVEYVSTAFSHFVDTALEGRLVPDRQKYVEITEVLPYE